MSWEVVRASELDHIGHGWILANFPRPLAVAKAFAMLEEVEGKGQGQWFDWKSAMLASFVQHSAILQTKTGFVECCWLERLEGFTVWMFMMVYASVMTMSDNHDRCWSSVNVSGRREAWKWTAKQTRQRWAKLVTHSDTTLRKSHDLKQKRDLSCRRDAGLTELIKKWRYRWRVSTFQLSTSWITHIDGGSSSNVTYGYL